MRHAQPARDRAARPAGSGLAVPALLLTLGALIGAWDFTVVIPVAWILASDLAR